MTFQEEEYIKALLRMSGVESIILQFKGYMIEFWFVDGWLRSQREESSPCITCTCIYEGNNPYNCRQYELQGYCKVIDST